MDQDSSQPSEKSPVQAAAAKTFRLFFIDHLRAALAILVVLHHVAMVYGASSPFYYVEPPFNDPLAYRVLLVFALVNQSWFMGAFFLLAGYFTPGSFDRKGLDSFVKDRLTRLGIPLIIFILVLSPISSIGFWLMPASLTGITTPLSWEVLFSTQLSMGPLWFVAMLLVFSLGYAEWRRLTKNRTSSSMVNPSLPSYLGIGILILGLAGASYLVRTRVPIGKEVLEFPTLAYLPQYLSFFVLGGIASRHDWFRTLPSSMGAAGLVAAATAGVFLFPLAFSGRLFSLEVTPALTNLLGNGQWQSAVYALWDSIFAVGLCLGLITLFRRFFNGESRYGTFLSQHSYTVYMIHIPIIVFLAFALRGIDLANLPKFGLAAVIVVPTCFAVAYIVRRIPRVSSIL